MKKAPVEGCFVEFGVYQGNSLRDTIKMAKKYLGIAPKAYGFDSFSGMPLTKRPLTGKMSESWREGAFADTGVKIVQKRLDEANVKATLIANEFRNLPPLRRIGIKKIRFAYLDADIYEGYKDALRLIAPHLQVGSVIIFDEYFPPSDPRYNESVRQHGMKAIREWEDETGTNLHVIRFAWSAALCVIVDNEYLKKYGSFIESLRRDNIVQSAADAVHQLFQKFNL